MRRSFNDYGIYYFCSYSFSNYEKKFINMKKFIKIIILSFFWAEHASAASDACVFGWFVSEKEGYAEFEFENKSSEVGRITSATIKTANSDTMYKKNFKEPVIYVMPYTKKKIKVFHNELIWRLASKASIECSAITLEEYKKENKPKFIPEYEENWFDKIFRN